MNENRIGYEIIYFYNILLRVGLVEFSEYKEWLDNVFLEDTENQNELLIELEYATNSKDKTIQILDEFFYDKQSCLDYDLYGKMLTGYIKKIYMNNKCDVEDLSHKLYDMWKSLPYDIDTQEPFHMMSYIDDPISYGDRAQTIDLLERFIDFYE